MSVKLRRRIVISLAVFVAADLDLPPYEGLMTLNELAKRPPLAVGKVRFVGEAVAAVAAVDRYTAEDAAALIDVEYEPLPVVTDPFEALKPGAATVHEPLGSNLAFEKTLSFGDVNGDFASADRVIRRTLRWHRASAQPLETAGALCRFDPVSQRMDVWSNTNMINYVGWLLAFWATPTMTVAHLLFAVLTTAYILIAIRLEARDLVEFHGERYAEYRRSVPMLVPRVRVRQPAATKVARTEIA